MARLHERANKLTITDYLRFAKNAVMKVVNSDGTTSEVDLTELGVLDVTPGTGEAGKALVLDSSGNVTIPEGSEITVTNPPFEIFDDFTMQSLALTGVGDGNWIAFAGSSATIAAIVTAPEGKFNMEGCATADANEGAVLSLILLAKGSLVSLGKTVFEARVASSTLTGCNITIGLSDTLATAAEHGLYRATAGTVADGGLSLTNAACFLFDKDATDATNWLVVSENAGTISNSAAEESASVGPTADIYDVLRIEIDATGDARFYINGTLEKTETTAVATSALLIPFLSIDEAGTPASNTLSTDYIQFKGARPSSNA